MIDLIRNELDKLFSTLYGNVLGVFIIIVVVFLVAFTAHIPSLRIRRRFKSVADHEYAMVICVIGELFIGKFTKYYLMDEELRNRKLDKQEEKCGFSEAE
jgi:ABC-type tungstate transport system substrate-binding protein